MKTNNPGKFCPPRPSLMGSRLAALLATLLLLLAPLGTFAAGDDGSTDYIVKLEGPDASYNYVLTFTVNTKGITPDNETCWALDDWISNNGTKNVLPSNLEYIRKVSFDKSFANARPTSTSYLLYDLRYVETIENIENLNTEEVTSMSNMFFNCNNLKELDLSSFNTAKVTDMSDMFNRCDQLKELDFSSFNTANVTDMSAMFYDCHNLTELDLSKFNTANVERMDSMFYNCYNLTALNLSKFNTANVESMDSMFCSCKGLTELDLRSFNTAKVTNMSSMFNGCSILASLKFGEKFTTANVERMNSMFSDCKGLTELDLRSFNTANVKDMHAMFSNCQKLTALDLSKFTTANVARMDSMFCRCLGLTALDLSSFNTANVTNMNKMFYQCLKLPTITFGNSFNTSKVTDMSYMFAECSNLQMLDLSKFNTASVTTMFYMFQKCSKITALNLSSFDTGNVTTMHGMFYECSSLQTLDLSKFNTANVTTMWSMFCGCKSLQALDLSSFNTSKVTDMSYMFTECSNLQMLDLSKFNTEKVFMMRGMFQDCSKLETLDICNFKTNAKTIVNTGATVNTLKLAILMFGGCTSLKSLNLGNNDFKDVSAKTAAFGGKFSNITTESVTDCNLIVGTGFDKSVLTESTDEPGKYTWLGGTFILQPLTIDEENKGAFTAGTAAGIEYGEVVLKRTFNANAWNTLVVPFDVTADEAEAQFGSDVKIANYTGAVENSDGTYTLNFEPAVTESAAAESPTVITAHTPVFIYGATPSADGYTFANKTIKAGTPTQTAANFDFVGTYTAGNVAEDDYFIAADNKFYRAADKSNTIRATLATFRPSGTASAAKIAGFVIDGETTAINQPAVAGTATDGAVYNLQGQRAGKGYKGMIIQSGRKYVRK